jgi:hypothetical protein
MPCKKKVGKSSRTSATKHHLPNYLRYRTGETSQMDAITQYRQQIQNLLTAHASLVWDDRIQAETIFDSDRDRYQLVYVGWRNSKRVYGVVLHLDIIDNKIWIQQDGTEVGIANKLMELGIPKEVIVLAFDPPNLRQYTDFAIG